MKELKQKASDRLAGTYVNYGLLSTLQAVVYVVSLMGFMIYLHVIGEQAAINQIVNETGNAINQDTSGNFLMFIAVSIGMLVYHVLNVIQVYGIAHKLTLKEAFATYFTHGLGMFSTSMLMIIRKAMWSSLGFIVTIIGVYVNIHNTEIGQALVTLGLIIAPLIWLYKSIEYTYVLAVSTRGIYDAKEAIKKGVTLFKSKRKFTLKLYLSLLPKVFLNIITFGLMYIVYKPYKLSLIQTAYEEGNTNVK